VNAVFPVGDYKFTASNTVTGASQVATLNYDFKILRISTTSFSRMVSIAAAT
jgi:hypothetical protein